eukprot:CAMPEP_0194315050 /NCGR_PEP_ID=MMETSP0171-20130528/11853_1 /TAXON_ID=218684 /ORGANISM="Corethron pennatum, Strain L29A3" /LENGTH=311 /DNA_ID=CAMNT_0039070701 /DNA_START=146 /DNA_END=1078 /DNA_ORIENTATION=-
MTSPFPDELEPPTIDANPPDVLPAPPIILIVPPAASVEDPGITIGAPPSPAVLSLDEIIIALPFPDALEPPAIDADPPDILRASSAILIDPPAALVENPDTTVVAPPPPAVLSPDKTHMAPTFPDEVEPSAIDADPHDVLPVPPVNLIVPPILLVEDPDTPVGTPLSPAVLSLVGKIMAPQFPDALEPTAIDADPPDVLPASPVILIFPPAKLVEDPDTIVVAPPSPVVLSPDETVIAQLFPDALEPAIIFTTSHVKPSAWVLFPPTKLTDPPVPLLPDPTLNGILPPTPELAEFVSTSGDIVYCFTLLWW